MLYTCTAGTVCQHINKRMADRLAWSRHRIAWSAFRGTEFSWIPGHQRSACATWETTVVLNIERNGWFRLHR